MEAMNEQQRVVYMQRKAQVLEDFAREVSSVAQRRNLAIVQLVWPDSHLKQRMHTELAWEAFSARALAVHAAECEHASECPTHMELLIKSLVFN